MVIKWAGGRAPDGRWEMEINAHPPNRTNKHNKRAWRWSAFHARLMTGPSCEPSTSSSPRLWLPRFFFFFLPLPLSFLERDSLFTVGFVCVYMCVCGICGLATTHLHQSVPFQHHTTNNDPKNQIKTNSPLRRRRVRRHQLVVQGPLPAQDAARLQGVDHVQVPDLDPRAEGAHGHVRPAAALESGLGVCVGLGVGWCCGGC